jgi:hypothetical protein
VAGCTTPALESSDGISLRILLGATGCQDCDNDEHHNGENLFHSVVPPSKVMNIITVNFGMIFALAQRND